MLISTTHMFDQSNEAGNLLEAVVLEDIPQHPARPSNDMNVII